MHYFQDNTFTDKFESWKKERGRSVIRWTDYQWTSCGWLAYKTVVNEVPESDGSIFRHGMFQYSVFSLLVLQASYKIDWYSVIKIFEPSDHKNSYFLL